MKHADFFPKTYQLPHGKVNEEKGFWVVKINLTGRETAAFFLLQFHTWPLDGAKGPHFATFSSLKFVYIDKHNESFPKVERMNNCAGIWTFSFYKIGTLPFHYRYKNLLPSFLPTYVGPQSTLISYILEGPAEAPEKWMPESWIQKFFLPRAVKCVSIYFTSTWWRKC